MGFLGSLFGRGKKPGKAGPVNGPVGRGGRPVPVNERTKHLADLRKTLEERKEARHKELREEFEARKAAARKRAQRNGRKHPVAIPVPVGKAAEVAAGNKTAARIYELHEQLVARKAATRKHPVAIPQDITLPRKVESEAAEREWQKKRGGYGTREGAQPVFADEALVPAFLAGTATNVTSSWLAAVRYRADDEELEVWFLNGYHCIVEDVSRAEAVSFWDAPSKGGWYWDNVLGPGYIMGSRNGRKRWRDA